VARKDALAIAEHVVEESASLEPDGGSKCVFHFDALEMSPGIDWTAWMAESVCVL
jgi:hypothetical protein